MNKYFQTNYQSMQKVAHKSSTHLMGLKCPRNIFLCEDDMCCGLALPWFCEEAQESKMKKILNKLSRFKRSLHSSDICVEEKEKSFNMGKNHSCICREVREMEDHAKMDELVWKMVGVAHEIIKMESELKKYYPEMIFFLNYLVTKYPALKEKK